MAISRNNSATSQSTGTTSITTPIVVGAGEIVVYLICLEDVSGAVKTVTGVTDTNSNTYAKRFSTSQVPESNLGASEGFEVWWAYSPSASGFLQVTATFSAAIDDVVGIVAGYQGFTGTAYQTNPWDANGSLPAVALGITLSVPTVTGVSTTSTAGMLLAGVGSCDFQDTPGTPTGFSIAGQLINSGGTNAQQGNLFDKVYAAAQSSVTIATTTGSGPSTPNMGGWILWADALTSPAGAAAAVPYNPWPLRAPLLAQ